MSGGGGSGKIDETEAERAQAEIALNRFKDYTQIFKPYEDKYMSQVEELNSPASMQRASELAINPMASEFAKQGVQVRRQMQSGGVNPNSGKALSFNNELATEQASAEVDTASRTTNTQQDSYVAGKQNIVAIGQGQATQAISGLSDVAGRAQLYASDKAQDAWQSKNNIRSGVGALVGAGTSYGLNQDNDGGG